MTDDELVDDSEAIGNLVYVRMVDQVEMSLVYRYAFDPAQEHKLGVGKEPCDPRTDKSAGEIVALDPVKGTVDLKRGKNSTAPHPRSLTPGRPLENVSLRVALQRVAEWSVGKGIDAPGACGGALDRLTGGEPRLGQVSG